MNNIKDKMISYIKVYKKKLLAADKYIDILISQGRISNRISKPQSLKMN